MFCPRHSLLKLIGLGICLSFAAGSVARATVFTPATGGLTGWSAYTAPLPTEAPAATWYADSNSNQFTKPSNPSLSLGGAVGTVLQTSAFLNEQLTYVGAGNTGDCGDPCKFGRNVTVDGYWTGTQGKQAAKTASIFDVLLEVITDTKVTTTTKVGKKTITTTKWVEAITYTELVFKYAVAVTCFGIIAPPDKDGNTQKVSYSVEDIFAYDPVVTGTGNSGATPLPAALPLMGTVLAGAWFASWRRRRSVG